MRNLLRDESIMQFATHIAAAVIVSAMLMPAWSHAEEVPAVNPMSGDAKSIREGRSWFMNVCSPCHGGKADGSGERGTAADLRKWNKGFRKFVATVKGGKDTGRAMTMPAWGGVLDEKTIFQIGAFVETLQLEGANWKEGVAQ
jgi:mono/diheme cytochrome c family protein